MRDMLKRIVLVIFVLLLVTAVSGYFYMQKHPLEGNKSGTILNFSGKSGK
ncbi:MULTISPECIES: hypothetical protein [Chryseobacterium]|jgi:hypothetical protein|uniref:Uncharacterized protein n=4 Tax=Chryseobacterium TaxID=59732 RepID=A0A543EMI4_9FLAO|nr:MULTISPECIES: hypothetical protein [Chryseobacterium]MBP1167621.1 hypothetical protein [Chryseobacterium sp. PvR013]MCC3216359.1 hypothetical protein [Chryseobacterium sp. X308]MCP1300230.1 hypothetical protein [Chryseobacterium sp. S0630]MDQ1855238.1 hypothetical protein [Chryseobacterium sp. WLY505]MDR4893055.1 hypothetical protein [Chryseobacterium sp. CFS7]